MKKNNNRNSLVNRAISSLASLFTAPFRFDRFADAYGPKVRRLNNQVRDLQERLEILENSNKGPLPTKGLIPHSPK